MRIDQRIDGNIVLYDIFIIRGDTPSLTVFITDADNDGALLPFVSGDTVYFTVKDSKGAVIISKEITTFTNDGKAVIDILASDTSTKKAFTYRYDVRCKKANGDVMTILYPSNFEIESEVSTIE